jgi:hypothetical protein
MKRISIFLALISLGAAAHADFVIQQKVEGGLQSGDMTMKIKGDKVRVDMAGPAGDVSSILDMNTGDSTVLMHQQKMAMNMPAAQLKQTMERMKNQNGNTNAAPPQLVDTGKTGMVGGYDAEIYTWTNNRDAGGMIWVSKTFPDYTKIKVQLDKLENSPVSQMSKGLAPDTSALPGMVMKSKIDMNGQEMISTLISAKEESVDASAFEVPADYQLMTAPQIPEPPPSEPAINK